MMNMDTFQLFFNHLEEQLYNNIYQNMNQDADYLEASLWENELNKQYKKLNLSNERRKVITQWIRQSKHRNVLTRLLFSAWVCSAVFPYCCNWQI